MNKSIALVLEDQDLIELIRVLLFGRFCPRQIASNAAKIPA